MAYAADFIRVLRTQIGDPYIWAREVNLNDPNPHGFDCSEYTEWGVHRIGLYLPDGSSAQHSYCKRKGTIISVRKALATQGALLWHPGHIAVSVGNSKSSIEAKGKAYGVGVFSALGRGWEAGMLVPGLHYTAPPKPPASTGIPRWPGRYITQPPVMKMTAAEGRYQQQLAKLGYYHGKQDLLYGPGMEAATVEMQKDKHLKPDGVVGDQTWYAAFR